MANRLGKPPRALEGEVWSLYGSVVTGTSGAITSQSCKGFTVAKTAGETGRYTVTLGEVWTDLLSCTAVIIGTADATYTSAKGLSMILRNDTVGVSGGKTFDIQFVDRQTAPVDAEVENSAVIKITIVLKNTSSY